MFRLSGVALVLKRLELHSDLAVDTFSLCKCQTNNSFYFVRFFLELKFTATTFDRSLLSWY